MRDRTPSVTACQHATATVFQRGMLLLAGSALFILASTTLCMSQVAPRSQGPREKSINIHTDTRKSNPKILDPRTTALVMIDLQKGVLGLPLLPHPAPEVLESASKLAGRFRHAGTTVVWVRASWSPGLGDALRQPVDKPMALSCRRVFHGATRGPREADRPHHHQAAMGGLLRHRARPPAPPTRREDHRPRRGRHQLRRRIDGTRRLGTRLRDRHRGGRDVELVRRTARFLDAAHPAAYRDHLILGRHFVQKRLNARQNPGSHGQGAGDRHRVPAMGLKANIDKV